MDHIYVVWDALFIRQRYFAIIVAVSLLCSIRSRLLAADFSAAVAIVSNPGGIDIHHVIRDAVHMWECTPSSAWPVDDASTAATTTEEDTLMIEADPSASSNGSGGESEWEPGKPARTPAELVAKMRWERRQQETKRNAAANSGLPSVPRITLSNLIRLASIAAPSQVIVTTPSRTQPLPSLPATITGMNNRLSCEVVIIDIRPQAEYQRSHFVLSTWIDSTPPTRPTTTRGTGITGAVKSLTGSGSTTTSSSATGSSSGTGRSLFSDPVDTVVNDALRRIRSGVGAERRYVIVIGSDHEHQSEFAHRLVRGGIAHVSILHGAARALRMITARTLLATTTIASNTNNVAAITAVATAKT